ncbi:MAG: homoserine kinase [Chloroflexi bacterium]|nr:MAG: homoserine kinase [Chloroflexota bacterium]
MKITIAAPATSANIGPGFDTLGMALNWTYKFKVSQGKRKTNAGPIIDMIKKGFRSVYQQFEETNIPNINIEYSKNVLVGKGLGTSAACYLTGITAANEFLNQPMNKNQILDLAIQIEGHADNVIPAFFGGLRAIVKKDSAISQKDEYLSTKIKTATDLQVALLVPSFSMPTKATRKTLPKTIPLEAAIYNISRAAMLVNAISQKQYSLLEEATKDKLHQEPRSQYFPEMKDIFQAALNNGAHGVFLSGGGPTIGAFVTKNPHKVVKSMEVALKKSTSLKKICTIAEKGLEIC